jgi:hypothetical protein
LLLDLVQRPVVVVGVLDLLEVRDGHAARVGQEVRKDVNALFKQNLVGFGRGRLPVD